MGTLWQDTRYGLRMLLKSPHRGHDRSRAWHRRQHGLADLDCGWRLKDKSGMSSVAVRDLPGGKPTCLEC